MAPHRSDAGRDKAPRRSAPIALIPWLAASAFTAYGLLISLLSDMHSLVQRTFDDAGYYLRIAANVANDHSVCFDGLHATNGYQPLWMFVLVPLFRTVHGTPEAMFRAVLVLQTALLLASFALLWPAIRRALSPEARAIFSLGCAALVFQPALNGMETPVVIVALCLWFAYEASADAAVRARPRYGLMVGLVMGITILARLDLLFLVVPAFGLVAWRAAREQGARGAWRTIVPMALGLAVVVAPYLATNLVATGRGMPVSGLLKSTFPHFARDITLMDRFGARHLACIAIGLGFLAANWHDRAREHNRPDEGRKAFDRAVAAGVIGMTLHAAYSFLFMQWAVHRWHFAWYLLVALLAACRMADQALTSRSPASRRAALSAALALAAIASVLVVARSDSKLAAYGWRTASYDTARWARRNLPRRAIVAMHDAGIFGYFSERRTINLDGVVNDLPYQRELRDRHLASYLARNGVTHLVDHELGKTVDVEQYRRRSYSVFSHDHGVWSDSLVLDRGWEVFRTRVFLHEQRHRVVCAIWQLPGLDERMLPDP